MNWCSADVRSITFKGYQLDLDESNESIYVCICNVYWSIIIKFLMTNWISLKRSVDQMDPSCSNSSVAFPTGDLNSSFIGCHLIFDVDICSESTLLIHCQSSFDTRPAAQNDLSLLVPIASGIMNIVKKHCWQACAVYRNKWVY